MPECLIYSAGMCYISLRLFQAELGELLFPCFGGTSKIPCNRINMKKHQPSFIEISTAETGSIQLEFRELGRKLNQSRFEVVVFRFGSLVTS